MGKGRSHIGAPISESTGGFNSIFNEFYPVLVIFANRFIPNVQECEGIVQEVFVRFWTSIYSTKRSRSESKSFLFTAVKNSCIDHLRHSVVEEKRQRQFLSFQKKSENMKDLIAESELQRRIEDAIERLPQQCRKIFLLSRTEGLSYKEIALKLDLSKKTVEAQIGKALSTLRKDLKEYL